MHKLLHISLLILCFKCENGLSIREYSKEDILKLREEVREMFQHAYDSYLRYAYPYDELRPLSCDGLDTWGSYSLTLIDSLDMLVIMGNYTEFNRVVDIVLEKQNFDSDINVSVFETNIRIVGGLLSAHLLSYKSGMKLEPGWPCNGPLLRLAEDVAQRLIAAFDTTTGMPYGTINLRKGVPPGETSITCTAGVGTFIIEFGTLSRLTGDPLYEEVALNALKALYHHRSPIGLVGNHIDVMTGRWTAQDSGIGGGVDSYFEYLVKGESDTAMRIIHNYHSVWKQYGFTPEVYNLGTGEASSSRESYPLRPELIESIMYLYRETRDPILLQMGEDILRSIQHSARTPCGYATIKDVRDHRKEDRMESFFLAETTKYLYLLFDPDNFIHNPGVHGTVINTPNGECIIDMGGYVFNTEAHPIDPLMLYCCHEARQGINISEVHRISQILDEEDNIKFMTMIDASMNRNVTNTTETVTVSETITNDTANTTTNATTADKKVEQNQELIKTETRTGYVNIDGTEREKNNESLGDILKEHINNYYNNTKINESDTKPVLESTIKTDSKVEVDDIIVPKMETEKLQPPSSTRAKEVIKILPKVLQDYINNDYKPKSTCEPQRMLERIRNEKRYPDHPDIKKYGILLTSAPSFMQRVCIAGEFLNRKHMEL